VTADSEQGQATAIASETVLAELIKLRGRRGITFLRVREEAKGIQQLAVTKDEARRRNLAESDLHIAAYYAIQCAVERGLRYSEWVHICRVTLNFSAEDKDLRKREESLWEELVVADKKLKTLRDEAYVELAGLLVSAEQSFCREPQSLPPSVDIGFTVSLDIETLQRILALLTVDKRKAAQEALHRALLALLPNARRYLYGEFRERHFNFPMPTSEREASRLILTMLLQSMRNMGAINLVYGGFGFNVIEQLLFSRLHTVREATIAAAQQAQFEGFEGLIEIQDPESRYADTITERFFNLKAFTLKRIAEFIESSERGNYWPQYIVPGGLRFPQGEYPRTERDDTE